VFDFFARAPTRQERDERTDCGKMEAYGPGSGRPGNNVCVVGTGVTGLLAVKNLVEQGLSVRALEKSENLGGNWYHSMDTEQVSALPEMKVNISKETVSGGYP
jgi:dimethylaniline monooxygenase (N-oxide forming)